MTCIRTALFCILFGIIGMFTQECPAQDLPAAGESMLLLQGNVPLACIVVPEKQQENLRKATECLRDCILKSTGVALEIKTRQSDSLVNIHIGLDSCDKAGDFEFTDLEEFGIFFPGSRSIVLAGGSPAGTEFAIYEFLERYLGVRWLFPGELGEHIPRHDQVNIPRETVRQCPAFLLRHFFGLAENNQQAWIRKMRINCSDRLQFHHNLDRIFTAEAFGETHPEFFPLRAGRRFIPPRGAYSWQPCFSAEGSAAAAAERICQYFSRHPDAVSFSLGVNDNTGHCRCEQCLAKVPPEKNRIGLSDYSSLYYPWVNEVVEKTRGKYPDKYFGGLAYNCVITPPAGMKLNDHFVPMITFDTCQWVDENTRGKMKEMILEWQGAADILGWSDYLYGGVYEVPRIWFHAMADCLRYAYEHKVRYYAAEAPQKFDWREGPKLYLAAKLLWDPQRDPDEILSEWYRLAVGEKAAHFLKHYFAFLEHLWSSRIPETSWFKTGAGKIYLNFESDHYLAAMDEKDIAQCDEMLRSMLAYPGTPEQQRRAAYFYAAFKNWSVAIRRHLLQKVVDVTDLIPGDSLATGSQFWNLQGAVLRAMVMCPYFVPRKVLI